MTISGRSSGTGKYSYEEASGLRRSVMVSHMPDDHFSFRIAFKHLGEPDGHILKLTDVEAELLWSALKRTAANLEWDDRMPGEDTKK